MQELFISNELLAKIQELEDIQAALDAIYIQATADCEECGGFGDGYHADVHNDSRPPACHKCGGSGRSKIALTILERIQVLIKQRDLYNKFIPESTLKLAQINRALTKANVPGSISDVPRRVDALIGVTRELQKWKGEQQNALIKISAMLLSAGFKGDGVTEGVKWLCKELAKVNKPTKAKK